MSKDTFLVIRGALHWAKLTGKARPYTGNPKYNKGPYWSVDITPDAKSMKALEEAGLTTGGSKGLGKMRKPKPDDKSGRKGLFMTFKVLEYKEWPAKADTEKNRPPKITDAANQPWNNGLLGNGTIADIKVKVVDYGDGMKGCYYQAARILDHVPYEANDFEPLSSDDEFFASDAPLENDIAEDDLDDDVPF
jgi:hypothetical protein